MRRLHMHTQTGPGVFHVIKVTAEDAMFRVRVTTSTARCRKPERRASERVPSGSRLRWIGQYGLATAAAS